MKTTIDIADSLFVEVKRVAQKKGRTIKQIIESALWEFLTLQKKAKGPFKLKKHVFQGDGLHDGISETDWSVIRAKIYEGRGE